VSFVVQYSASAKDDSAQLFDYLVDQATTVEGRRQ
jgi:hypothetical protein